MKSLSLFLILSVLSSIGLAQDISSKQLVNPASYGQKKFRKAPKKIFIANFKVFFQTTGIGRAFDNSAREGTAVAEMHVKLNGISEAVLQELTDEAYAAFATDLKKQGFDILTAEQASHIKFYEGWTLVRGGQINHDQLEGYAMGIPTGYNYFIKKETKKGKQKGGNNAILDQTPRISKQLDDAIVIDVALVFPFAEFNAKKAKIGSKITIDAQIGLQMRHSITGPGNANKGGFQRGALAAQTHINFVYGNPAGFAAQAVHKLALKEPVFSEASIFSDASFQTVTSATKTLNVSDIETFTTSSIPEAYKAEVSRLTQAFTQIALEQFYGYALK